MVTVMVMVMVMEVGEEVKAEEVPILPVVRMMAAKRILALNSFF
jgi:hypothetical protein